MFNARKIKRRYFDYCSDDDDESADGEYNESVDESSNGEVVKKQKNVKKKTVAKFTPPLIKQMKKQQKGIIDYLNS